MIQLAADLQAAALANESIAFELNAAAAHFDRQGQQDVAEALREQAAALLTEASRLQTETEAPMRPARRTGAQHSSQRRRRRRSLEGPQPIEDCAFWRTTSGSLRGIDLLLM